MQLIERLRPRSLIEIGTNSGGSALWFADITSRSEVCDPRITFLKGDALQLAASLPITFLQLLPHPWLVVEDSAHLYETCSAVLRFFDPHLSPGDYIVVEDGKGVAARDERRRR